MAIAKVHVYPPKEPEDSDVKSLEEEIEAVANKRLKHGPLAEFRNVTGFAKRYFFHTQTLTHFLNLKASYLFDHGIYLFEIFKEYSYSIWLHFNTKSKLISIRSQVLHHFVCGYVKCVEKVPFHKSSDKYCW